MFRRFIAHTTVRLVTALALFVAAVYLLILRNMYYRSAAHERSRVGSAWSTKGFALAVVWPPHTDPSLVEGVTLASEEVNAGGGALAGKIRLRYFVEHDDRGATARDVVKANDVVAVIGHEIPGTAVPASVTYEDHGMLFLSAKSTDVLLTSHGFNYTFRLTPDDEAIAQALARFAYDHGWKRVGTVYGRIEHGESASAWFVTSGKAIGLDIPFSRSFLQEPDWASQDFRPLIAEVRKEVFDALMVADVLPWAARLLVDMARMGVTQPVLATDKLDSVELFNRAIEVAGQVLGTQATNTLYVASSVDPGSARPEYAAFRERFRQRFKTNPGFGASQGYEAFMLFVNACLRSQSADPIVVSTTLRTGTWTGLFGGFSFERNGDIVGRAVSIKHMQNGVFETVSAVTPIKETPQ